MYAALQPCERMVLSMVHAMVHAMAHAKAHAMAHAMVLAMAYARRPPVCRAHLRRRAA